MSATIRLSSKDADRVSELLQKRECLTLFRHKALKIQSTERFSVTQHLTDEESREVLVLLLDKNTRQLRSYGIEV